MFRLHQLPSCDRASAQVPAPVVQSFRLIAGVQKVVSDGRSYLNVQFCCEYCNVAVLFDWKAVYRRDGHNLRVPGVLDQQLGAQLFSLDSPHGLADKCRKTPVLQFKIYIASRWSAVEQCLETR